MTRTLFAFAELTNLDLNYTGPEFDFEKMIKDLMIKVCFFSLFFFVVFFYTCDFFQGIRRKSSIQDTSSVQTNINSIFANLMQVYTLIERDTIVKHHLRAYSNIF